MLQLYHICLTLSHVRFGSYFPQEKIGPLVFRVISSHRDDLVLRAESKERMNDWLFGFHRALAGIIAQVIENKGAKGFAADGSGGEPGEEDDEFSHGFGFGDRGAGDGTGGGERCGDGDSERGGAFCIQIVGILHKKHASLRICRKLFLFYFRNEHLKCSR